MTWEDIVNSSKKMKVKTYQVFQEKIQKSILTSLSREGVFNKLVFQGGTSLHFFYGNPRFSEDLHFVLRQGINNCDLTPTTSKIQSFIGDVFPYLEDVNVNVQKNNSDLQRFIVRTISNIPEQTLRIHIEVAKVPSYLNQPRILDYPPLNPAVRVEHASEILADKVTALGSRPYLKGRDIWDIYFLIVEKDISIPWDLVIQKAKDYGNTIAELKKGIITASKRIKGEDISILSNEMKRFLPKPLLDQYSEVFDEITTRVAQEVEKVRKATAEKQHTNR
ncbi:MAG: nucleotidyl transferase AbiEii/AbiGii toxin family protein [Petrotogales bacterium]